MDGFIRKVCVKCMNRTPVNMLQRPKTQINVRELGHLWLLVLQGAPRGAPEAFVQAGSKMVTKAAKPVSESIYKHLG